MAGPALDCGMVIRGIFWCRQPKRYVHEYRQLINKDAELNARYLAELYLNTQSACGQKFNLMVNSGLAIELETNQSDSTDGVGLYRTEFPFIMRSRFPTELEQVELYRKGC